MVDGAIEREWAVIKALKDFKPDLVGISALTPGRHQGLWVARVANNSFLVQRPFLAMFIRTLMWRQC